jgi:hypothetical protein
MVFNSRTIMPAVMRSAAPLAGGDAGDGADDGVCPGSAAMAR